MGGCHVGQVRPPRVTVWRSWTQAAHMGVPSGAAALVWSTGSGAAATAPLGASRQSTIGMVRSERRKHDRVAGG